MMRESARTGRSDGKRRKIRKESFGLRFYFFGSGILGNDRAFVRNKQAKGQLAGYARRWGNGI